MTDVTQILSQIEQGDPNAAEQLLPLVYDELRKLAAARMAAEAPGQTLQATALVHEAYLRLVAGGQGAEDLRLGAEEIRSAVLPPVPSPQPPVPLSAFNSRGHFFAAAAEAMRRILVERARRRGRVRHGGEFQRQGAAEAELFEDQRQAEMLQVDAALDELAEEDPRAAELVKLRFFVGMTTAEAAEALGVSTKTVERSWVYAKAWLREALSR
ncbi:MAG TPA: sigma-70 family RNA polymerase sigma factor [Pirellulaceae bacterium]|nr:sigma-70 family RNA polymerase sigma factor [Pirellulaceae bacterium]